MPDAVPAQLQALLRRNRGWLSAAAIVVLAVLGFVLLQRLLHEVRLRDVRAAFHALPPWRFAAALGFTAASYGFLTFYDVFALRLIGRPMAYRVAALASFTSYTLSHNLGLALLTGGSARYRIYSAKGLLAADVLRVIAIASFGFWSAVVVTVAAALAFDPQGVIPPVLPIPASVLRMAGATVLAVAGTLLIASRGGGRSVRFLRWSVPLPTRGQAVRQVAVAALDLAAASAALYVLVPGVAAATFPQFFLAYALAIIVALLTHVPGGLGVFEAVMIAALPRLDRPHLAAALIAYRAIYYLLPLALAVLMLAWHERTSLRRPLAIARDLSGPMLSSVAPMLLSAMALAGGTVLLVSGSLPAIPDRLRVLRDIVPLPFVEASHIAASLAGTALLLMAPGLLKRLDGAFLVTRALLVGGAAFSLAKGIDYEEALVLAGAAVILQLSRKEFYRKTALTMSGISAGWLAAVGVILSLSFWLGLFAYKHVGYQSELWWEFAWRGNAPRFLRASFAAAVLLTAAMLLRIFGPRRAAAGDESSRPPDDPEVFADCDRTDAMLAWTGDKRFLRSPSGAAFVMYQVQGQSWIVMGDPVGPREQWPGLLWSLRERADVAQGRLVLYQVTAQTLPIAIDLGLQLIKYGEEARVDLAAFSLEGAAVKDLRHAERRAVRDGAEFDVVPAAGVPGILAELRAISDEWLASKGRAEKAFSVGRFDPAYLKRFDCAVVRQAGRIVAFANIWATENRNELSVDLMRHRGAVPYGTMDFLFIRLMRWGQARSFRWFSLGLAPLSGIDARRLAPVWAHAGALLYRHGDGFYGFEGLRAYKDKFAPVWEPRYVAGPHGIGLARSMIDLQTLVGGRRGSAARMRRKPRKAPLSQLDEALAV